MYLLGINANIMSLGGIAIAIGVMVDSSIVMVENSHKHLECEKSSAWPPARRRGPRAQRHRRGRQGGRPEPLLRPADHRR